MGDHLCPGRVRPQGQGASTPAPIDRACRVSRKFGLAGYVLDSGNYYGSSSPWWGGPPGRRGTPSSRCWKRDEGINAAATRNAARPYPLESSSSPYPVRVKCTCQCKGLVNTCCLSLTIFTQMADLQPRHIPFPSLRTQLSQMGNSCHCLVCLNRDRSACFGQLRG